MKQIEINRGHQSIPDFIHHYFSLLSRENWLSLLALGIGFLQYLLRIGAMEKYGFHQDELLYIALSEHLAWGYSETPPLIALIGKLSMFLFGDSLVAFRTIPCFCAIAIVYFTGKITIKLNGGVFAVIIACSGIAFSSAFLATGSLFIPQVFDELCWVILAYQLVLWVKNKNDNYLILAVIAVGIGLYIKYTIIIYALGLFIGLMLSAHPILLNKKFWMACLVVALMLMPHILWQFENGFPAFGHYQELRATQLIYHSKAGFISEQLAVNGTGLVIWVVGFFILFNNHRLSRYKFLLYGFAFVMLVLLILNGKSYYGFGAFPPLFAIGAIFWERRLGKASNLRKSLLVAFLVIPNLILAIIVLPHLPIEKAAKVFKWTYINLNIHYPLKWEDQKIHNMNQNYADMIGWDELAVKTSSVYQSLPEKEKAQTVVFANKYGEAGAIDYYQQKYRLPHVISFSSSYSLWAPADFYYKNIILITDSLDQPNLKGCKIIKKEEIKNKYARIKGMDIYLIKDINSNFKSWYLRNKMAANQFRME